MDYLTISQITKNLYRNTDCLDPPLNYYLKLKSISLYDFIIQHNLYNYDKPALLNPNDEEKIIIDERLEAYHRNPTLGAPWEDVYKRIVSKR